MTSPMTSPVTYATCTKINAVGTKFSSVLSTAVTVSGQIPDLKRSDGSFPQASCHLSQVFPSFIVSQPRVPLSLTFVSTWKNLLSLSKNFFLPFGPQFGLKIRGRGPPPPRAPPLELPLLWTGISSPSQCWRGGSVLWTIFIEIKKIII